MMKNEFSKWITRLMALTLLSGVFVLSGCGDDDGGEPEVTDNVWEVVQNDPRLSGLEAELAAAGLDGALANTSNITLFAPSNDALELLLNTLGIEDFSEISSETVQAVLSYHVSASVIMSSDLAVGNEITTLVPGEVITVGAGPVLVTGASSDSEFVETDIEATNGVVHIVDVVLVPPTIGDLILQTLGTVAQPILLSSEFEILAGGVLAGEAYAQAEGLPSLFDILTSAQGTEYEGEDWTVFAPNDDVLSEVPGVESLTGEQWYGIISKHVAPGIYEAADLTDGLEIPVVAGINLTVSAPGSGGDFTSIFLDSDGDGTPEAEVAAPSVAEAGNGVIHVIAGVL